MIEIFSALTGNVFKVLIALEEMSLPYRKTPVDIAKGEQFKAEFLALFPNNKVPAIVDHAPADGGAPVSVFESAAILIYLAEKTGRFLPRDDLRARAEVFQWLSWQVAGLGPMIGQLHYFKFFAPHSIPHALERYDTEMRRLYRVLNGRLAAREFVCGDYSIADMACFGWAMYHDMHDQDLSQAPHVERWLATMSARPAVQRAMGGFKPSPPKVDDALRRVMFLQR